MKIRIHKHIGFHFRRFHGHVTKYLYERDTVFATLWVFILIGFLKFIFSLNMHFFDPISQGLDDFDLNDIGYSKIDLNKSALDSNIVIVNIGHADREELAYIIEKTNALHPKIMGLDAYFEGPRDSLKDAILRETFEKTNNLVVISRLVWEHHGKHLRKEEDYFEESFKQTGFGNLTGQDKGVMRNVSAYEKLEDSTLYCFAGMLVKNFDDKAFRKFKKRKDHNEIINYTRRTESFKVIDYSDIMNDQVEESYIKGKIVLLGYVSNNPFDIEDKVFTPMNPKFSGKSVPDMNGIVVHANIISMILSDNYIKKLPSLVNILVAILIGWLHMSFFIRYYLENHIWFHLVAKLAQLASAIFFVFAGMILYHEFHIKLDMKLTLVVIVLSVDIIYFYEAFAVWMHQKFGYTTVFHHKHH